MFGGALASTTFVIKVWNGWSPWGPRVEKPVLEAVATPEEQGQALGSHWIVPKEPRQPSTEWETPTLLVKAKSGGRDSF